MKTQKQTISMGFHRADFARQLGALRYQMMETNRAARPPPGCIRLQPAKVESNSMRPRARILIVEDDRDRRSHLEASLRKAGYVVTGVAGRGRTLEER